MEIYLVGGAVRDSLLDLPARDKDWVVVGSNARLMKEQGYLQVGKGFPVFLHPETKQEYALARTERQSTAPCLSCIRRRPSAGTESRQIRSAFCEARLYSRP